MPESQRAQAPAASAASLRRRVPFQHYDVELLIDILTLNIAYTARCMSLSNFASRRSSPSDTPPSSTLTSRRSYNRFLNIILRVASWRPSTMRLMQYSVIGRAEQRINSRQSHANNQLHPLRAVLLQRTGINPSVSAMTLSKMPVRKSSSQMRTQAWV